MPKKDESKGNVTYWLHKGSGFSRVEDKARRNYGNGDVVEFGPSGPPAAFRDLFDQVVNPSVETEGA